MDERDNMEILRGKDALADGSTEPPEEKAVLTVPADTAEFASVADIPIGGFGILMAKNSVDDMRYERMGDSNVVTIVKN